MPRFFFDFRQGDERISDAEGIELPNVEQAYLEAFEGAQEMWSELLKQRRDPRRCTFVVRNQHNETLFIFPFQEVVDSCTDSRGHPIQMTFEQLHRTHQYAQRVRAEFMRQAQATRRTLWASRELLRRIAPR